MFVAYSLWNNLYYIILPFIGEEKAYEIASEFFYLGTEFAFSGYTYLIFRYTRKEGDRWNIPISQFIFVAASGAVIDRIFFDPYRISLNDYLMYLVNLILIFYNARKSRTKNRYVKH